MLLWVVAIVVIITAFEMVPLIKLKYIREMVVLIFWSLSAVFMSIYYLSNPFGKSFSNILLGILNIKR